MSGRGKGGAGLHRLGYYESSSSSDSDSDSLPDSAREELEVLRERIQDGSISQKEQLLLLDSILGKRKAEVDPEDVPLRPASSRPPAKKKTKAKTKKQKGVVAWIVMSVENKAQRKRGQLIAPEYFDSVDAIYNSDGSYGVAEVKFLRWLDVNPGWSSDNYDLSMETHDTDVTKRDDPAYLQNTESY